MKKTLVALLAAFALATTAHAQLGVTTTNLSMALQGIGIAMTNPLVNLLKLGVPFTFNGQTFVIQQNSDGTYTIQTSGVNGTEVFTPPTTVGGSVATAQAWLANNNAALSILYGTNEIVARVGVVYLQDSGRAAAELAVEKYFGSFGVEAALFQGNQAGKSGTAGAAGFVGYRKIFGDVSAEAGLGGGWDNWNGTFFGAVKGEIELRQSQHLGEFVTVAYAFERVSGSQSGAGDPGGLIAGGGVTCAF